MGMGMGMGIPKLSSDSGWSRLPQDLLHSILNSLVLVSLYDCVRCSAVCMHWNSVAKTNIYPNPQAITTKNQLPLLLIPTCKTKIVNYYNVTNKNITKFQLTLLPFSNSRYCGSSHGWLITINNKSKIMTLFNPFSGDIINLPPSTKLEEYAVQKVILTGNPLLTPDNYMVVIIYRFCPLLAFIKSGDKVWTYLQGSRFPVCSDVIYYKGKILFVVDDCSTLFWIDLDKNSARRITDIVKTVTLFGFRNYIVESLEGDILLVRRFFRKKVTYDNPSIQPETIGFKVSKLVRPSGERPMWKKVKSLGDEALFLGKNYSMSVLPSNFPRCQPNAIYYTEEYLYSKDFPRDMGVFDLEEGSIKPHYTSDPKHKYFPPPIWIQPTLK